MLSSIPVHPASHQVSSSSSSLPFSDFVFFNDPLLNVSLYSVRGDLTSFTTCMFLYLALDRLASVGVMVWIGLNHLKNDRGWQWSDGAPLSLVNFTTGTDYLFGPRPIVLSILGNSFILVAQWFPTQCSGYDGYSLWAMKSILCINVQFVLWSLINFDEKKIGWFRQLSLLLQLLIIITLYPPISSACQPTEGQQTVWSVQLGLRRSLAEPFLWVCAALHL